MNGPNDREAMTRRLHRLQVAVGGMRRRCNNLNLGADPCQIENMLQQKLSRLQSLKAQNDQLDAVLEGGKRKAQRDEPNARLKDNLIIQVRFAQAVHQQAQRDVRDAEKKLREDEVVLDKTENLLKKRSMCPASPAMMQVDTIRQLEKHKEMLAQSIDVGEKRYQSQRRELLRIIQDRREKMDEIQADINRKEKALRQLYRSFPRRNEERAVDPRYWSNIKRTDMVAKGKQKGNAGNGGNGQRGMELFANYDSSSQRMPTAEELSSEIRMLKIRRQG